MVSRLKTTMPTKLPRSFARSLNLMISAEQMKLLRSSTTSWMRVQKEKSGKLSRLMLYKIWPWRTRQKLERRKSTKST
ncbi:unnamed protein product, partial [Cylicostephanus goldi]